MTLTGDLRTQVQVLNVEHEESGKVLAGRQVYLEQCVFCHGEGGQGDGPWSKEMTENRPRDFTKGVFKFRSTPMGSLPTDADLERTIRSGVATTAMPTFASLPDTQIDLVIGYIQTLSTRWRDPRLRVDALPLPESPPRWWGDPARRAGRAKAGQAVFEVSCAPCHGLGGRGDGEASNGLVDLWGHAIRPADLTAPHWKSGDRAVDWYRTVATGLDGTPMVGFAATMEPETLWALVAYIGSLRSAASESMEESEGASEDATGSIRPSRPNSKPASVPTIP